MSSQYTTIRITIKEFENPRGRYKDEGKERRLNYFDWLRQSIDEVQKSLEQNGLSDIARAIIPLGIGQADIAVPQMEAYRVYSRYKTMHINDEFTAMDLLTRTIDDDSTVILERLFHHTLSISKLIVLPQNDELKMWHDERLSQLEARKSSLLHDTTKEIYPMNVVSLNMFTLMDAYYIATL